MNTLRATLILAVLCTSFPAKVASQGHTEAVLLCHGLGETVGMIHDQRENGVSDENNRGLAILEQLEQELEQNLLPVVDKFLENTTPLPAAWRATLFTHACLYNYTEDTEQVVLMSQLINQQCNLKHTEASCIDKVFASLPSHKVI